MKSNLSQEIIPGTAAVLHKVSVPATIKKFKLQKIRDLSVPKLELIYQADASRSKRVQLTSTQHAYDILLHTWDMNKIELVKQIKVLLLTNSNRVLGVFDMTHGCMDKALIDFKFIFSAALLCGAGRIILGNNNTGGSLTPSSQDKRTTESLVAVGKLMGIDVLDHIILTKEGYFSFVDNGLITHWNID